MLLPDSLTYDNSSALCWWIYALSPGPGCGHSASCFRRPVPSGWDLGEKKGHTYHQRRQPLAQNAVFWQNLDSGPGEEKGLASASQLEATGYSL